MPILDPHRYDILKSQFQYFGHYIGIRVSTERLQFRWVIIKKEGRSQNGLK